MGLLKNLFDKIGKLESKINGFYNSGEHVDSKKDSNNQNKDDDFDETIKEMMNKAFEKAYDIKDDKDKDYLKKLIDKSLTKHNVINNQNNEAVNVSANTITDKQLVEYVVSELREKPPGKILCYMVLFGDRPLTGQAVDDETDIMCFTQRKKAEDFMKGYQSYYKCSKPLSILAVGKIPDLWSMLNNKSLDTLYEPPYGLLINFNYSGQTYNRYSVVDLKRIGIDGLSKGFSSLT